MTKKIAIMLSVLALLGQPALAASSKEKGHFAPSSETAIEDGLYDVEGEPNLKVKVHVYKQDARGNNGQKPGSGGGPLVLKCNLSDLDSDSVVPSAGWRLPTSSPVTYRLNLSVPGNVDSGNLGTIAQRAFSSWSEASNGQVSFVRGNDTSVARAQNDGQNIVAWGRTSGTALAVTYTWYNTQTKVAVETDTIFNSKFAWAWSDEELNPNCAYENAYDAQNILAHELGHWMGLGDIYTSEYTDNTMYGYGSKTEVKKNTLTSGDIAGVMAIY